MTPEGQTSWGSQLVYSLAPAPSPAPFSLVFSPAPLYHSAILQAVQAVQSLPPPQPNQPSVNHYYKETKKNVKPIAPKSGIAPSTDSKCTKKRKTEYKTKAKQIKQKVTSAKMREEFILKSNKRQNVPKIAVPDDEDSTMPNLELQVSLPTAGSCKQDQHKVNKREVKAKKLASKSEAISGDESDGDIIKTLQKQVEDDGDSDLDLFVPAKESKEGREAAFEKLLSSAKPRSKRTKNPCWVESPTKREKPSLDEEATLEVVTAPWGQAASSFDLSDDYVNDYLKDKARTDSTKSPETLKPPGLLMISPPTPRRTSSRAVSMDVIPACLPDSVGSEIGDILRGGFLTISPPGPRTPRRRGGRNSGRSSGRSSPQKAKEKAKNVRTKSTEDLPPNLLPEDYLDEVIGQYFNNDSSSEEEQRLEKAKVVTKSSSNTDSEDDSSTEEGDAPSPKKARSRPPASFFSMEFLEEPAHSDSTEDKVKTDLEIEKEYRHILYGKKRKPAKISTGKKKKIPSPYKNSGEKLQNKQTSDKTEKAVSKHKVVQKQKTAVLREANGKAKASQPVKKSVQTSRAKSPVKESEPPNKEETPTAEETPPAEETPTKEETIQKVKQHQWRGKTPNTRAYDRSKMLQNTVRSRPNVSAKIEDVTGRYSKEEELAACGICEMLDPPIDPENPEETTEWVGCDCFRWFHKGCTKLTKFTEKFSCKSVKMKCLEQEPEPVLPEPEVLRIAILKFCRDRDTIFIEDVIL